MVNYTLAAVLNLSLGSSWPLSITSPILVNGAFVLDHKSTLVIALSSSFPLSGVPPITAKGSLSLQGYVLTYQKSLSLIFVNWSRFAGMSSLISL